MSNTYIWVIDDIFVNPSIVDKTDVVVNVNYHVNGTDGTHTASIYNNQNFTYTEGSSFTPYSSLTQEQVINWIKSAMEATAVNEIQSTLDAQIANMAISVTSVKNMALPWA